MGCNGHLHPQTKSGWGLCSQKCNTAPCEQKFCGQFHQHCTREFYVRKCFMQLFSSYILALQLFGKKILAKKASVKYWWNWHLDSGHALLPQFGSLIHVLWWFWNAAKIFLECFFFTKEISLYKKCKNWVLCDMGLYLFH